MKRLILSTLVMAATASSVFAQTAATTNNGGAFVRVGVGYAFPMAGDYMVGSEVNTPTSFTTDMKKSSYGAGFNAVIAGGYMFNPHIGIELGIGAGLAMKKNVYEFDNTFGSNDYKSTSTSYSKMPIMIMPSIVLATGNTGLEPYARIGLAINVAGKIIEEYEETDRSTTPATIMTTTTEYETKVGLGIQGALGLKYHISDMLGVYLELNGLSMSANVKNSEVTEVTVNGVNLLGEYTINELQTEYSSNYTETFTTTPSASVPAKAPAMTSPFSNLGLGLGVTIRF